MRIKLNVTLKGSKIWPVGLILDDKDGLIPDELLFEAKHNPGVVTIIKDELTNGDIPPIPEVTPMLKEKVVSVTKTDIFRMKKDDLSNFTGDDSDKSRQELIKIALDKIK